MRTGIAALIMNYLTEIILVKCSATSQFLEAFIFSFGHALCAVVLKKRRFWQALFCVTFNC